MKPVSIKRIVLLSVVLSGVCAVAVFQAPLTNAAEEGISKMNSVISPAKPPLLDAEIPKHLETATFALG